MRTKLYDVTRLVNRLLSAGFVAQRSYFFTKKQTDNQRFRKGVTVYRAIGLVVWLCFTHLWCENSTSGVLLTFGCPVFSIASIPTPPFFIYLLLSMKRTVLLLALPLLLAFGTTFTATAQRFCYVDVNKVLERVPEYKSAQDQLDKLADQWKQDIQQEYARIEEMYRKYQADEVLLDKNSKTKREEEIAAKEKQVRELQKQKFGPEGALFKKRQELVKPIQDRVYTAIEQYAAEKSYDFIFDKASASGMLFASPRFDKTDDVAKKLGY